MARADDWNHNVHNKPVNLRAIPAGCSAEPRRCDIAVVRTTTM